MSALQLNYTDKSTGGEFSRSDNNEIRKVVNNHANALDNRLSGSTVLLETGSITGDDTPEINQPAGKVITAVTATAAGAVKTITITNSFATADSIVMATMGDYGGDGTPILQQVTPGAGSIVILIYNAHASAALSAAFDVNFAIVG